MDIKVQINSVKANVILFFRLLPQNVKSLWSMFLDAPIDEKIAYAAIPVGLILIIVGLSV